MNRVKQLQDLTEDEYDALKHIGMLKIIYPDAPDTWKETQPEARPERLETVVASDLFNLLDQYIEWNYTESFTEDEDYDWKRHIYETTMLTFYGPDIFHKLKEIRKRNS